MQPSITILRMDRKNEDIYVYSGIQKNESHVSTVDTL